MKTKPFSGLLKKMTSERRTHIKAQVDAVLQEMPLNELRKAKALTQVQVAEMLHIEQAAISKMENQTDMYINTLRRFIEAMGGELEIVAKFQDGSVRINQFQGMSDSSRAA